jgi:filamentous hemagglutinin
MKAGRSPGVKVVGSEAELDALYGRLGAGGKPATPPTYKGSMVELPDGTKVGLRGTSISGGKTIDIFMPDKTYTKVHIE